MVSLIDSLVRRLLCNQLLLNVGDLSRYSSKKIIRGLKSRVMHVDRLKHWLLLFLAFSGHTNAYELKVLTPRYSFYPRGIYSRLLSLILTSDHRIPCLFTVLWTILLTRSTSSREKGWDLPIMHPYHISTCAQSNAARNMECYTSINRSFNIPVPPGAPLPPSGHLNFLRIGFVKIPVPLGPE